MACLSLPTAGVTGICHLYLACNRLLNPAKADLKILHSSAIRKQKEEGILHASLLVWVLFTFVFITSLSVLRMNITSCEILALRITDRTFETFVLSLLSFREPRGRGLWEGLERKGKGKIVYNLKDKIRA